MDSEQLLNYRNSVKKLKDNELAGQYRAVHRQLTLKDGEPTPDARAAQEFIQLWREAHRRRIITPAPPIR